MLQHRIPGETRRCVVVSGIQPICLHAAAPKVLEDISKEQNIRLEIQVGVFTQCGDAEFLESNRISVSS